MFLTYCASALAATPVHQLTCAACRPQSRVEDALKHWAAHHAEEPIPRPLLRELLEGDLAVGQLAAGVNLLGSRLAAARAGGRLVVASVCGRIGEELSVAVLAADGSGEFQVLGGASGACSTQTARRTHCSLGRLTPEYLVFCSCTLLPDSVSCNT